MIVTHEHKITISPVNKDTEFYIEFTEKELKSKHTPYTKKESTTAVTFIYQESYQIK